MIYVGRVGSGQANVGVGVELEVIAAVLIGGVSILGGEGAVWRAAAGVAAATLFTEDGIYAWGPFHEPIRGTQAIREAWANAAQSRQEDIRFGYEILGFTEDGRGIARWWASMLALPSQTPTKMEGIFLVTLAGRCDEFREWWNQDPVATGASEYQSAT